jgi:DNA-binding HxlR family transcriptional regulator
MKPKGTYGQFCPVALTCEVLAERWTPLVIRELSTGSRRFADIHRGVPLMSPTMLTRRLRELEQAEVIVRRLTGDRKIEYHLTRAGQALFPIVMQFAVWGKEFARMRIQPGDVDPGLLIWEIRRYMDPTFLPKSRTVILFRFPQADKKRQLWWLVADKGEVDLCVQSPGIDVDLTVDADMAELARLWRGDVTAEQAVRSGKIRMSGSPLLAKTFGRWVGINPGTRPRKIPPLPPPRMLTTGASGS